MFWGHMVGSTRGLGPYDDPHKRRGPAHCRRWPFFHPLTPDASHRYPTPGAPWPRVSRKGWVARAAECRLRVAFPGHRAPRIPGHSHADAARDASALWQCPFRVHVRDGPRPGGTHPPGSARLDGSAGVAAQWREVRWASAVVVVVVVAVRRCSQRSIRGLTRGGLVMGLAGSRSRRFVRGVLFCEAQARGTGHAAGVRRGYRVLLGTHPVKGATR